MAGSTSLTDQFMAELGFANSGPSTHLQMEEALRGADPVRLAAFNEAYKRSIASGHTPADAAFSALAGTASADTNGDANFASVINTAFHTGAHLAVVDHNTAAHALYIAAARTNAYVKQDTNYAAADERGHQAYGVDVAHEFEVAQRVKAEQQDVAMRNQRGPAAEREMAQRKADMRVAQARAPSLPTHYGQGDDQVSISPDRDAQGRPNGKFIVMAPDRPGGSHVIGDLTAAQIADIRKQADQSPGRVAEIVRSSVAQPDQKSYLMVQINGNPNQENMALLMARIRAQQAGQDPNRVVVAEDMSPASADQLHINQPQPGSQGAERLAGHPPQATHHPVAAKKSSHHGERVGQGSRSNMHYGPDTV